MYLRIQCQDFISDAITLVKYLSKSHIKETTIPQQENHKILQKYSHLFFVILKINTLTSKNLLGDFDMYDRNSKRLRSQEFSM